MFRNADESYLIKAAQEGDREAFSYLYRTYSPRVYTQALRMSGDSFTAEDMTQEIFIRVWEKLETFRGESAFSTWLYRLSMNLIMRKTRGTKGCSFYSNGQDDLPIAVETAGKQSSLATEDRIDLLRAIRNLPVRCRGVLVLHELLGYDHGEVATIMNITRGTSKSHLYKAKKILKKELAR